MQRIIQIAELRHALGHPGSATGIVNPTTASLPDGEALLEQSHAVGGFALADRCNSTRKCRPALRQQGQAVFASQSHGLCGAVQVRLVLALARSLWFTGFKI